MDWPRYFNVFNEEFYLNLKSTVLLPVDLQYASASRNLGFGAYLSERNRLDEAEYRFSRIENSVIPNTKKLIKFFRDNNANIIFITLGCEEKDFSDAPTNLRKMFIATNNVKGTREHEILDQIKPNKDELVINKRTQGAFTSTGLETVLRAKGIENIIITGVSTNMCVDMTAKSASELGFKTVIVADATGTCSESMQLATERTFSRLWGRVLNTEDVIKELQETK